MPSGTCRGFALLNHQTRRHLNRILNEDDNKYIESCVKTIQRGCDAETEEGLVREVLRYISHEEPQRQTGFLAMCEATRPARTSETVQPELQIRLGFLRMLDPNYQAHVANGSEETHSRIPCGFREMIEAAFPHGNRTTPDDKPHVVRGMGFAAMLEGARRGTE